MPETLAPEKLAWAEKLLGLVIDHPEHFSEFQVDFAMSMADRAGRFRERMYLSSKQQDVLDGIERRAESEGLS
ncbi:MAG: hypothetical protein ABL951_15790 [Alphaproteobacteria bacterium]